MPDSIWTDVEYLRMQRAMGGSSPQRDYVAEMANAKIPDISKLSDRARVRQYVRMALRFKPSPESEI